MTPQELRNSIFRYAISGKLTKQNKFEDSKSAIELAIAKRTDAENKKLIKKEKRIAPIGDDEIPFDIPKNWSWTRLIQISSIEAGGTPDRGTPEYWNGRIPWLKIGDISDKHVTKCSEYITELGLNNSSAKIFKKGTVLYTIFATIGRVGILDFEASTNQAIAGITFYGDLDIDYLYYVLISLKDVLVAQSHGMAQMNINQAILKQTPIPIPPVEEQKRIVKKIEQLLSLVDRYEEAWNKIEQFNRAFPTEMEKSLLFYASQGKLVNQNYAEGTGKDLLGKIIEARNKQLPPKKRIVLRTVNDDKVPFDIPSSWVWCRIGDIADVKGGKRIPAGRKLTSENTGHIYLRVSDMKNYSVSMASLMYVPNDIFPSISRYIINKDDVYITVAGTIGAVGCIPDELDGVNLTENADRLIIYNIDKKWLMYCLSSDVVQQQIKEATTKVGQPKLAIARIENLLIPLPPYEEQKRIVTKLEELLPLCRNLIK